MSCSSAQTRGDTRRPSFPRLELFFCLMRTLAAAFLLISRWICQRPPSSRLSASFCSRYEPSCGVRLSSVHTHTHTHTHRHRQTQIDTHTHTHTNLQRVSNRAGCYLCVCSFGLVLTFSCPHVCFVCACVFLLPVATVCFHFQGIDIALVSVFVSHFKGR